MVSWTVVDGGRDSKSASQSRSKAAATGPSAVAGSGASRPTTAEKADMTPGASEAGTGCPVASRSASALSRCTARSSRRAPAARRSRVSSAPGDGELGGELVDGGLGDEALGDGELGGTRAVCHPPGGPL